MNTLSSTLLGIGVGFVFGTNLRILSYDGLVANLCQDTTEPITDKGLGKLFVSS